VLVKNDDAFRRQVADNLTKEVGQRVSAGEVGCEGCWGNIHSAIAASLECRIRQCCEAKAFTTCAECTDFPCPMYLEQFPEDSHYVRNIRAIRKDGLGKWIAQRRASAACRLYALVMPSVVGDLDVPGLRPSQQYELAQLRHQ